MENMYLKQKQHQNIHIDAKNQLRPQCLRLFSCKAQHLCFILLCTSFLVLGALPFGACGTVTQSVLLPLHYTNAPTNLTNNEGWQIQLTQATLSIGVIRCLKGKPAYSMLAPQMGWFPINRAAFAHPGHYLSEGVKAEFLFSKPLDLLKTKEAFIGHLRGFTGHYGSIEVEFSENDKLHLEGTAVKGDQSVRFAFDLAPGAFTVKGIDFRHKVTLAAPTVHMRLSMVQLFQWVHFSQFKRSDAGATPSQSVQNVLRKALRSNALYQLKAESKGQTNTPEKS